MDREQLVEIVRRLQRSVWSQVLGKAAGIACGMLALAAIGAFATARGLGGQRIALAEPSASGLALSAPRHSAPPAEAGLVTTLTASLSGEAALPAASSAPPPAAPSDAITPDGKVILNKAGVDDLRRLPGIGAKRAQAIIALREKLGGRFKRATDLLRVKGIGVKSLKRLEPHFVLDAPTPAAEPTKPSAGPS
jgi:competence protein ComEA